MKSKLKPMVFFLLILILMQVACAQERGVRKIFGFTEEVIGGFFARFSESPTVWMRMLLIIALFALLYYGALHLLKFPPRIAVPIALTISIIGIIGIPRAALLYLLKTYSGFVIAASILLPTAGLLWLTYKAIKAYEESRIVKLGFAFVWGIFLGILLAYSDIVQGLCEKGVPVWVIDLAAFIAFIAIVVLLIWSFLRKGRQETGAETTMPERRERRIPRERRREAERIIAEEIKLELPELRLVEELEHLVAEARKSDKEEDIKRAVKKGKELVRRIEALETKSVRLNQRLKRLLETNPEIERDVNRINYFFVATISQLEELRKILSEEIIDFNEFYKKTKKIMSFLLRIVSLFNALKRKIRR